MALNLTPTDVQRQHMLTELHVDLECDCFTCSPRLTPQACNQYPDLVEQAIREHDDAWLEAKLLRGCLLTHEPSIRSKTGLRRINQAAAAKMLGEGTWNNLCCRGQCQLAINNGSGQVEIFRAANRHQPRRESQQLIGQRFDAQEMLEELRGRACDPDSGQLLVPGGPNSGISVRAVDINDMDLTDRASS